MTMTQRIPSCTVRALLQALDDRDVETIDVLIADKQRNERDHHELVAWAWRGPGVLSGSV